MAGKLSIDVYRDLQAKLADPRQLGTGDTENSKKQKRLQKSSILHYSNMLKQIIVIHILTTYNSCPPNRVFECLSSLHLPGCKRCLIDFINMCV